MSTKFYYDFTRKEVVEKKIIQNYYGIKYKDCSDSELKKINIYPIRDRKVIPGGWQENPIASIEELVNQGPLYVHNGTYAWRLYRIYRDKEELDCYKDLQLYYISDIESLWNKKTLKSLSFFEKIKKIIKIISIIAKN